MREIPHHAGREEGRRAGKIEFHQLFFRQETPDCIIGITGRFYPKP